MTIQTVIKENAYFDSVTLMTISTRANELAGVKTAMIGMGTDMNLEVIRMLVYIHPPWIMLQQVIY